MNSASTVETPESIGKARGRAKMWRVGTLVYTSTGLVALFGWLLWGDFAWAMKDRSITVVLQMLLKTHGASDTLTGFLLGSLPALIGMMVSPIISYKSDRLRSRWGRRIPFLVVSIPFTLTSMIGLAFSPWLGRSLDAALGAMSPGVNPCILISFGFFWMIFDVASATANAVLGGLINDVVPQAVVGRFFGMFRAVSLLAGILFNTWMMGSAEENYQLIFIGCGLLYAIGFSITCFRVKEGQYPPVEQPSASERQGRLNAVKTYFRDCFSRGYYNWFYIAPTLAMLATLSINLFSVFYARSIGMSMTAFGQCLAVTYGISLVLAYPLGWLADRFHPLRLVIGIVALYGLLTLLSGIYAVDTPSFAIALVVHGVMSGAFFTAASSLGQRLLPKARFAEMASAGGLIGGLASIALGPLLGFLLDHCGHDYRYTFFVAAVFSVLSVIGLLALHARFMKLGGPRSYVAPE